MQTSSQVFPSVGAAPSPSHGSAWVPTVKNTFVNITDPNTHHCKRQLKPTLSCGDVPNGASATAKPAVGQSLEEIRAPIAINSCQAELSSTHTSEHQEFPSVRCAGNSSCIPVVKNTFVEIVDASGQGQKRQLKPILSCGDVPDPKTTTASPDLQKLLAMQTPPRVQRYESEGAANVCTPPKAGKQPSGLCSSKPSESVVKDGAMLLPKEQAKRNVLAGMRGIIRDPQLARALASVVDGHAGTGSDGSSSSDDEC